MSYLLKPTSNQLLKAFVDITAPQVVDVSYSDKNVLWVNVDGVCVLRICRIPHLQVSHPDGSVTQQVLVEEKDKDETPRIV